MIEQRFEEQLAEVRRQYESGDNDLGLRRLLNCAIETQVAAVFREPLAFCDWFEIDANKQQDPLSQVLPLLEKMQRCGVKITTEASNFLKAFCGLVPTMKLGFMSECRQTDRVGFVCNGTRTSCTL